MPSNSYTSPTQPRIYRHFGHIPPLWIPKFHPYLEQTTQAFYDHISLLFIWFNSFKSIFVLLLSVLEIALLLVCVPVLTDRFLIKSSFFHRIWKTCWHTIFQKQCYSFFFFLISNNWKNLPHYETASSIYTSKVVYQRKKITGTDSLILNLIAYIIIIKSFLFPHREPPLSLPWFLSTQWN